MFQDRYIIRDFEGFAPWYIKYYTAGDQRKSSVIN